MGGVPILNKMLSIAAFGFEEYGEYRLGVMLTPWFMNLLLLPLQEDTIDRQEQKFGTTQSHILPGGQFAFIVGHEEDIGPYLSCSLFSPVFEFASQEAAEQTARAVLQEVLTPTENNDDDIDDEEAQADAEMRDIWAGRLPEQAEKQEDANTVSNDLEPSASKLAERPQRKTPSLSSEFSRRDVLRGLRSSESQKEQS